jgi:macrolide transport system ATP-binding/permease protein
MSPRRLWQWLRDLAGRARVERELDEELDFHLQTRADQLQAQGLARAEALRRARIELGMLELHRDDVRAARGLRLLDQLRGDVLYALRGLRRSPMYALTATVVLALPLAAALLLHAIYAGYAYQSPPIERVNRWVQLQGYSPENRAYSRFTADEADALLKSPPPALAGLYSLINLSRPLLDGQVQRGMGIAVSPDYFQQIGVGARLGRVFDPANADSDEAMGVVLSEDGWAQLFERAPDVVGRSLDIGGQIFALIGVADRGFNGNHPVAQLFFVRQRDYRAVFQQSDTDSHDLRYEVGGFLAPEADIGLAEQQLQSAAQAIAHTRPPDLALAGLRLNTGQGRLNADDREEMVLASMPAGLAILLMLLVASANLANLVLARFSARASELGVRAALGASRLRLLLQLWLECGLIGLGAAMLALALGAVLLGPVHARVFSLIAEMGISLIDVRLSARSLLPVLALAFVCTLAFGLLPALAVTRRSRASGNSQQLGQAMRAGDAPRLRAALMVTQIAASCFLLVIAGLIAANARRTLDTPLGYAPERLVGLSAGSAPERLAQRLRGLPEVEGMGASNLMPLMGEPERVAARAQLDDGSARSAAAQLRPVDAAWFELLGLRPLRGRLLRAHEDSHAPVAVISRSAAERLWPGTDPVGASLDLIEASDAAQTRLRLAGDKGEVETNGELRRRVEIVGVVPDIATGFLFGGGDGPVVYVPGKIGEAALGSLLLRLRDTRAETRAAVFKACTALAPHDSCAPTPLTDALRIQSLPVIVAAEVASGLGAVALLISCLGLYGLVAYGVQQRRRELGLRLALGASRRRLIATVMRDARRQIALGLAIGLPLAVVLTRLLAQLTDRITLFDPIAFVGVPLLLALLAALAAYVPARNCASIDPAESLRADG